MSRVFDRIPEWITERSSRKLNQVVSDEKTMRIKLALHICDERQTELVIMELADDSFFIPAIFKPDDIRKKFGLSDLKLSIDALEERIVKIKMYAVSAYRSNRNLYPYLVVTDFEYVKGRSRIDSDLQHAYTTKQVENWIDDVQQSLHNVHDPVSKMFPSSALMAEYRNFNALECHLEAILSRMYKFEPRKSANAAREREHSNSICSRAERGIVASDAMYDHANHEQLATTSPMTEWRSSSVNHSRASPSNCLTLQAFILSTFDTMEEIPDELCIDSESVLKEETQASTPSPRPFAHSPHFVATSPSINASPVACVAASFSPEPMSFPSYSPCPSNVNNQMSLYDPRILNNSMLAGRPHELTNVPDNADPSKRRRLYSDYRLHYLT
ncbi:uncharacterized protein ATC70_003506 [Mucor velutinosus]|uniref:Uncharacterized protein n=1 Tax=Mucor velutinosus TaxID=708070 RepID=A0AAN7D936_9FUNG|nr:hypothetical protein ATC70_003506 [Mucor velutinosus]